MMIDELTTPALLVDIEAFNHNMTTMTAALPGARLRPHVKAFKSTAIGRLLADAGHRSFCCATVREMEGMAAAGLGDDLLLANEVLDAGRLGAIARSGARVTLAVDSDLTVDAATAGGVSDVLIDVNVGLARCGCAVEDAGRLADYARRAGLTVRGVMGYEGHIMGTVDVQERTDGARTAMELLLGAHAEVGGEIISAGGTGTYAINTWANEIQAGSYLLMDSAYERQGLPFRPAMTVLATVISRGRVDGRDYLVADAGLKAFGMDHGNPSTDAGKVWFCSDEHVTFSPTSDRPVKPGDRIRLLPAHVDPTVARHQQFHVTDGDRVIDTWEIDLRHW